MQRFQSTATEVLGDFTSYFPLELNLVFERTLSLSMPDTYDHVNVDDADLKKFVYNFDYVPNSVKGGAAVAEPSWESNLINTPKNSEKSKAFDNSLVTTTTTTTTTPSTLSTTTVAAATKTSTRLQQNNLAKAGINNKVTPFSSKKVTAASATTTTTTTNSASNPVMQHHSSSQSSDSDYDEDYDGGDVGKRSHYKSMTASQKREYRRERNRELAAESRERKRLEFEQMKEEIVLLRKENSELRSKLNMPPVAVVAGVVPLTHSMGSTFENGSKRRRRTNSAAISEAF